MVVCRQDDVIHKSVRKIMALSCLSAHTYSRWETRSCWCGIHAVCSVSLSENPS